MNNKTIIFLLALSFFVPFAYGQFQTGEIDRSKVPVLAPHYEEEHTFDRPSDTAAWQACQPGMHVSFGTTDQLYFRSEIPSLQTETLSWEATGWRGERLNAQAVVWSTDSLEQVRFEVSDLVGNNGAVLANENIDLNLVRYVLSNYPYGALAEDCAAGPADRAYLMPDRLEPFDRFDLPGQTARPVWIAVNIPQGAAPGTYRGTIEVAAKGHRTTLHIQVHVQAQTLPPPTEWSYRLDLWQNPWAVAWYYHVEPWSADHKALLKKHLKPYADAGGTFITTYAVHSPWSDNSYWIEGAMVDLIKTKNGDWKFDYRIFDDYVQLAMEVGIDEAITIYTPVPWENRFRYLDEASGDYVYESWAPGSAKFKAFWHTFLSDLEGHLKEKGWFEKTYLGINENPLEYTIAAAKVIKEHSPDWKITYAGNWHPELNDLLDDYCFLYGNEPSMETVQQRSAKGYTSTYYVCCNPAKPNNFVFSPPAEGRWISWYASAYGYDGFLRWAYDAWAEDPVRDARHTLWPAGDTFLVYPGGNSSIRFEKLREGIVDFEKIDILRTLAENTTDKQVAAALEKLENHLKTFPKEHDFNEEDVIEAVQTGNALLTELSDRLAATQK